MKLSDKRILVCDCGGTMRIDSADLANVCAAGETVKISHALCRSEIANFENALGEKGVIVGCTQEAPLFREVAANHDPAIPVNSVNIREYAGWGEDASAAGPKITALLAAAAVNIPLTPSVTLRSSGRILVYGCDETALEAARQLAGRLDVILVIDGAEEIAPPMVMDIQISMIQNLILILNQDIIKRLKMLSYYKQVYLNLLNIEF